MTSEEQDRLREAFGQMEHAAAMAGLALVEALQDLARAVSAVSLRGLADFDVQDAMRGVWRAPFSRRRRGGSMRRKKHYLKAINAMRK